MTTRPHRTDPIRPAADACAALVLRSPDALVAALPYLLGFVPRESAVVIWIADGRVVLTQRLDLPASGQSVEPWRRAMWEHAGARTADEIIVAFVTARSDAADLWAAVQAHAGSEDVAVRDVLLVTQDRWRSLLCRDETCCPAEGRDVDPSVRGNVAAEFTGIGVAPLESRECVAATLDADPGAVAAVEAAWDSVAPRPPLGTALEAWRDAEIAAIVGALAVPPAEESGLLAAIVSSLADIRVRDTVLWECARWDSNRLRVALAVLAVAVRSAPAGHVAPVASTYAVAAWLSGDGARALMATERALADDPDYSLALLVTASLQGGLAPGEWRSAMLRMPRAECRRG